jgi:acyl carrier protein
MYFAGDGIARGYLGRPDLTAARFVPNPFSTKPGDRLYRSGDLARYLSDGNIDFMRRIDHQVKLRGFRIELGEIETALHEHPAVGECVVVVREDTPNDKRLIAYVVPNSNEPQLTAHLRNWLRERLPDYFIPSFFVVLDKLPLTPNGKVDKRALPPPEGTVETEATFIAPRTPEEAKVAEIWADVLDIRPIDVEANFFDLGGHSLLATRVVTRIRETFGIQLPLRVMFDSPTIAAVAAQVTETREQSELNSIAAIVEKLTQLSEDETKSLLKEAASSQ